MVQIIKAAKLKVAQPLLAELKLKVAIRNHQLLKVVKLMNKADKHNNHLLRNHQLLPKVTLVVTTAVATTETMVIKA